MSNPPLCPECGTNQVQFVTIGRDQYEWKCRHCKTIISLEAATIN